jgi:hypothetical protein
MLNYNWTPEGSGVFSIFNVFVAHSDGGRSQERIGADNQLSEVVRHLWKAVTLQEKHYNITQRESTN